MSYQFYKFLHLSGIIMVLVSLGGLALHTINGGTKDFAFRKIVGITHGIGLLVAFVAGFGLMARLGGSLAQGWVLTKITIWVVLGGYSAILYKKPSKVHWFVIMFLAVIAAFLAQNKPF